MSRYLVRVWIDDFEVEADTPEEAEDLAMDRVNVESPFLADFSQVQKVFIAGEWKYTAREGSKC